ncbi:hypothetical protein ACWCWD_22720 [Streptomyces sp. NPDC001493]
MPQTIRPDVTVTPGPSVSEIRKAVRAAIVGGTYLPGALLSVGRVAADAGCGRHRLDRVRLALADLQSDGLCAVAESADHVRVAVRRPAPAATERIAGWLHELIRAGVHPPHSALPERQKLSLAMVAPVAVVTSALRLLANESVIVMDGTQRPTVTWAPDLPGAPDLRSLLSRLAEMKLPRAALDLSDIRKACSLTHNWWHTRNVPDPDKHLQVFLGLAAAAEHLLPFAAQRHPRNPEVLPILRRAAVTALADRPVDPYEQVWRTALLGAAVREVSKLALGPGRTA